MSWSKDLKNIIIENKNLTERQLRAGMFDSMNSIVLGSPVGNKSLWKNPDSAPKGYTGGAYRSAHRISINRITTGDNGIESQSGTMMRLDGELAKFKIGETLFMTNPLPYAVPIEYGHSSQAPNGVYRPAVRQLIRFLNKDLGVKR